MGALGGPKKIHQSALRALKAGADILCFSGLYDQSVFIETSFNTIKEALSTGTLGAEEILANGARLNSWKRPVSQGSSMPQQIATERFQKGLEIRGDIRLLGESIQLIELSADPTIAAGFVGWGLRRSLTHAGIKVKLESSDVSLDGPESGQVIVAFRDAFRDSKILAALERIYRQRPDTIFVDMGWPTRRFTPANIIRTFGSSALASELAVAAITNRD
jgi:beta-N-acetylhexosaminidase